MSTLDSASVTIWNFALSHVMLGAANKHFCSHITLQLMHLEKEDVILGLSQSAQESESVGQR